MTPEHLREFATRLADDVRVRFRRSERPPIEYAITLEIQVRDEWTTIRLWDNADDLDQHHEHAYTQDAGKQPPTIRTYASTNEAMAAAMARALGHWQEIVDAWKTT